MGTSKEIHFEDLRGLDLSYRFGGGFLEEKLPCITPSRIPFPCPFFHENYYHIGFQSPYFKIKLVWRVFVAF